MADLATGEENRVKLADDTTRVSQAMVDRLETAIDETNEKFEPPTEFVVPGENLMSAALDVARTVCRRAERSAIELGDANSLAVPYLNRLSDLLWTIARWQEGESLAVASIDTPTPRNAQ